MDWMKMKTLSTFLCTVLFLLFPMPTFAAIPEPGEAFGAVGGIAFEPPVVDAAISLSLSDEGQEQWGAGMKFNIFFLYCYSFQWQ